MDLKDILDNEFNKLDENIDNDLNNRIDKLIDDNNTNNSEVLEVFDSVKEEYPDINNSLSDDDIKSIINDVFKD